MRISRQLGTSLGHRVVLRHAYLGIRPLVPSPFPVPVSACRVACLIAIAGSFRPGLDQGLRQRALCRVYSRAAFAHFPIRLTLSCQHCNAKFTVATARRCVVWSTSLQHDRGIGVCSCRRLLPLFRFSLDCSCVDSHCQVVFELDCCWR